MTCPDQSHFQTQVSFGHSPLLAAFVMAHAKVRGVTLEQEKHRQGEHAMQLAYGAEERAS